jgi:precorrin-2 dehydrogenase/sirohydrochlorin ferrochelatase
MRSDYQGIFLPVALNITNKKILFIGGGKVTSHKLASVIKFSSNITILAPEIAEELRNDGRLKLLSKKYERTDLQDYQLVFACTNNRELNARIKREANSLGILVNVADDQELCDFISPAIYKNDQISISVSSNATDVKLAIRIRNWIKEQFENGEIKKYL